MNTFPRSKALLRSVRPLLFGLLCACSLPQFLAAQQNKVVLAPSNPLTAKRGSTVEYNLKATVLPGFHVNSDKPKDEYLVPFKLTWTGGPLEAKAIEYPKPEEAQVGTDNLTVFTGGFEIRTRFVVPPNAPAGSSSMMGKLRYQACNEHMCFRPATLDVSVPVTVE